MAASVPTPELATSEQPQSRLDAAAFNRPLNVSIAPGLEQLGSGLEDVADTAAKDQAASDLQKGVTLDAQGNPQVATPANSVILGRAGQDYHAAMLAGTRSALQAGVTNDLTDIRAKFPTDPVAFKTATDALAAKYRSNPAYPPQVADGLANSVQNEAAAHHAGMVEAQVTRDTRMSLQTIQTQITDDTDKLSALARQGATDTPMYKQLEARMQGNYHALTSNPLFGYSEARANSELATMQARLQGDMIVSKVDATFQKTGGDGGRAGAQKMLTDQILNNPDLHLDDAQRRQFYAQGMAHLEYLTSAQKAQIDANRLNVEKLLDAYKGGKPVDQGVSDTAIEQARSLGDGESVMKIQAYRAAARQASAYTGMSDEQRLRAMAAPAEGGYLAALKQQENNTGNPMAGNGGGDYQFTPSTWATIMRAHPELGLTANGRADQAQGARAIVAFTNDNKAALRTAGIAQTDANTYMAHFLGAGGATSFIKAMQANPGGRADTVAGFAPANANASIFYKPGGDGKPDFNQPRSLSEVYALQTRRFGGGTTPVVATGVGGAPSPAQMAANPFTMAAYLDGLGSGGKDEIATAKQVGEAMVTRFEKGDMPAPETVAAFQQVHDRYPDALGEISQKVDTTMRAALAANTALDQPTAQGAAYVAQVQASKNGADLRVQQQADAMRTIYERGQKAMKEEPFAEAQRRGWLVRAPASLDFSPQGAATLPQAMADRTTAAASIAAHTGVPAVSALAPDDLPQVKAVMASGPLDQRLAVLSSIANSGMPEPIMRATLEHLAGDRATKPLAIAGDVAPHNPVVARDILAGQALMQVEPKLAPNKDDYPGEFAKVLPFNDLPDAPARQNYDAAIQSLYAKRSADSGDTTGVLNTDRLRQVIDDVTGGVVGYRGGKAIAPWYGATQSQYDAAIRLVTDADLKGSRGSDGVPLPAALLKPSFSSSLGFGAQWSLQSFDGGKYLVYPNTGAQPRQYLKDASGRNFVLDLGAKRADVEAQGARLAMPPFSPIDAANFD